MDRTIHGGEMAKQRPIFLCGKHARRKQTIHSFPKRKKQNATSKSNNTNHIRLKTSGEHIFFKIILWSKFMVELANDKRKQLARMALSANSLPAPARSCQEAS